MAWCSGSAAACFALVLLGALGYSSVLACSCMLEHSQTHACTADFVIVARVKKVFMSDHTKIYKVKVKKEFKMQEKARAALKAGKLATAAGSSMCGLDLKRDETYLVTGRVVAGQARVSLCGYTRPWKELTARQRKGFRLLYRQGCSCQIVHCPWWRDCSNATLSGDSGALGDACRWETSMLSDHTLPDCQEQHAVCLRTASGACAWAADKHYKGCMKTRRRIRDEQLSREP
ncbi:metalloproteinase inhibitor 3 [Bacillus rossius redtenbacheri]|uniref:metalloproteinase inhibitor 3 n=1 Tax=Bacillus rossius redtenbacheri TaxID=93214 RepID=UPI002FDC9F4B